MSNQQQKFKTKVVYFCFEVPQYYTKADLQRNIKIEDEDAIPTVESMLHDTLRFVQKRFNKRIHGENSLNSTLLLNSEEALKCAKDRISDKEKFDINSPWNPNDKGDI